MHVFRGLPSPLQRCPSAVAIGNFDGVHLGHQALLEYVKEAAQARGLVPFVVTFEPHPKDFFGRGGEVARICTLYDKINAILETGIERIYILPFNARLASMPAERFVRDVLLEGLGACWVSVGRDFRFGGDRAGNVELLEELSRTLPYELYVAPTFYHKDDRVSSSRIRESLAEGDLYEASLMLGRPYGMTGRVIHGAALGRTLGFPTLTWRRYRRAAIPAPPSTASSPYASTGSARPSRTASLQSASSPRSLPTDAGFSRRTSSTGAATPTAASSGSNSSNV